VAARTPIPRLYDDQGAYDRELLHQAQAEGYFFDLFPKPIHPDELIARLKAI
jgi:DNA-binding response OmpR family regulator